jgi:hypothetical protein
MMVAGNLLDSVVEVEDRLIMNSIVYIKLIPNFFPDNKYYLT